VSISPLLLAEAERRVGLAPDVPEVPTVDGATFILEEPADVPATWGSEQSILWAEGEPLLIVGPQGVGKTTLGQQLALARVGLHDTLLDFPVMIDARRVLYIAADRPRQAARSFQRMTSERDRLALAEGLVVWRGPLPFDLTAEPKGLLDFISAIGNVGTVVIDSLKDVVLDLSRDETGGRVNVALQHVVTAGIEVVALHHQRKEGADGRKPRTLADVYGSTWITAGAGSVVLLWGQPGDPIVDLLHLKQPAEDVGPLKLSHDHKRGQTSVRSGTDLLTLVGQAIGGLSAP